MTLWKNLRRALNIGGAGLALSDSLLRPKFLVNLIAYTCQSHFLPTKPLYYPLTLMIEISGNCNLFCDRCERSSVKNQAMGQNTSVETIKNILPILKYAYSVYLVGGYGEAFLNPKFWQIHSLIKQTGVRVGFFTNGVLLNKRNIDKIFQEETDNVLISVDSTKKKVYEEIRKGAKFEAVVKNIKLLVDLRKKRKSKKPEIGLSFTFQKNNYKELSNFMYFTKDLGVDFISFAGVITHKKKNIKESSYLLKPGVLETTFNKLQTTSEEIDMPIRLPKPKIDPKAPHCPHSWRDMIVYYNGDVSPCPYFRIDKEFYFFVEKGRLVQKDKKVPALIMGNVNQRNILDIWKDSPYQKLRSALKNNSSKSPCSNCYFKYGVH